MKVNIPVSLHGLSISLVDVKNAEDIVLIRSDPKVTQYMLTIDSDVEKQKKWIERYKKREELGEDFYFVFCEKQDVVAFSRLSHIDYIKGVATASSWIKKPGKKDVGGRVFLSRLDIAFYHIHMDEVHASIHTNNKKALKHWLVFDCITQKKSNGFLDVVLTKEKFAKDRESYISLIIEKNGRDLDL